MWETIDRIFPILLSVLSLIGIIRHDMFTLVVVITITLTYYLPRIAIHDGYDE